MTHIIGILRKCILISLFNETFLKYLEYNTVGYLVVWTLLQETEEKYYVQFTIHQIEKLFTDV